MEKVGGNRETEETDKRDRQGNREEFSTEDKIVQTFCTLEGNKYVIECMS